ALDFARINVLPTANKHVVDATDESVGTGSIAPKDVTGLVPTFIGKHLFGFFRHVEVSRHIGRRADPQLTFRCFLTIGPNKAHLDTGLRPAKGEIGFSYARPRPKHDRARFRGSIADVECRVGKELPHLINK